MTRGFQITRIDVGRSHLTPSQANTVGVEALEAIAIEAEGSGRPTCAAQPCGLRAFAGIHMLNHGQVTIEVECRSGDCPSATPIDGAARLARTAIDEALGQ